MNLLIVAAAIATIFGCGFGAQSLLADGGKPFNRTEQLTLAWLLGSGIISMLIWIFGFFLKTPVLPALVLCVVLILAWIGWHRRAWPRVRRKFSAVEVILGLLVVLQIAVIFYLSWVHTLGWDGLLNWEIKARYAFLNNGVLPASYLQDAGRRFSHQEYPLYIPFTQLWLYFWLGAPDQFWAKIIFPISYATGVILLASSTARLTGRSFIGLIAAILLFFIPQITVGGGSAIVGYADFPLSVVYLATISFLIRFFEQKNVVYFRAYAACLALLPWVKQDGMVLWAVAALCGSWVIARTNQPRRHFLAFLPGLLVMIGWHFYLGAMHSAASDEFLPLNIGSIRSHLYRIEPIASALAAEVRDLSTWSLLWLLVALGCGHLLCRLRQLRSIVLLNAFCAPVALYSFAYVFSNWSDYLLHLQLSLSRLLMHVAPLGLSIAATAAAARLPCRSHDQLTSSSCTEAHPERTPAVEFA